MGGLKNSNANLSGQDVEQCMREIATGSSAPAAAGGRIGRMATSSTFASHLAHPTLVHKHHAASSSNNNNNNNNNNSGGGSGSTHAFSQVGFALSEEDSEDDRRGGLLLVPPPPHPHPHLSPSNLDSASLSPSKERDGPWRAVCYRRLTSRNGLYVICLFIFCSIATVWYCRMQEIEKHYYLLTEFTQNKYLFHRANETERKWRKEHFYVSSALASSSEQSAEVSLDNNVHIVLSTSALNASILFPIQRQRLRVYLLALVNGVNIIEVPVTPLLKTAIRDCYHANKPSLLHNQHALEMRFPSVLHEMNDVGKQREREGEMERNRVIRAKERLGKRFREPKRSRDRLERTTLFQLLHSPSLPQFNSTATTIAATATATTHNYDNNRQFSKGSRDQQVHNTLTQALLSHEVFRKPLFHYLNLALYAVVYCKDYGHPDKENWFSAENYWHDLSTMILHESKEWRRNNGMDFLFPVSHPKAAPFVLSSLALNEISRASFLRTDFDLNGYDSKDIVVPYYASTGSIRIVETGDIDRELVRGRNQQRRRLALRQGRLLEDSQDNVTDIHNVNVVTERQLKNEAESLLVFMGGNNPKGGLRSRLERALSQLQDPEVFFTVSQRLSPSDYQHYLTNSVFCLSIRGDTSSSSRLFSIIALNGRCIPVIISDGMALPFEHIVDYSQFSLRFPENVEENAEMFVQALRHTSEIERERLRAGVREAREMLLFEQSQREIVMATPIGSNSLIHMRERELSVLNPVTLSLIQMLQQKESYCMRLGEQVVFSDMCAVLNERLSIAERLLIDIA
jgi:hypothetical protein